ncbi:hypothetical protein N7537_009205 [Penicillium hordei]|uniref:Uncharacterized protein n=1 Tax=Penicillium hordei TaxID=40994 RepID=A0AAD6DSF2_9EURO|nr:uncharacterized protein N7537_009205 [Penicillium hordei]KAJ5592301.1 hypothetical protein N7537_009205 [Penicillium hordei]
MSQSRFWQSSTGPSLAFRRLQVGIISSQARRASPKRQFSGVSFDRSQFITCHGIRYHPVKWERGWPPLAALIARLSPLEQIESLVKNDFPIPFQEAISQHHPKCRLHLSWPHNVGTSVPIAAYICRKIGEPDSRYKYLELDALDISQLAKCCPQLEEFRLPIKRSRAVNLVLGLHFDPRLRPVYQFQIFMTSVLHGIFANATMGEKLALQIWHLISSNQDSRRLQNLRIVPFGLGYPLNDKERLLGWFSRSF